MRRASARPRSAVQQFALPALTTIAWQRPPRRRSSETSTGAARTLLRVKTPAAVAGRSEAMMQRSSERPSFLIPAWTAPALNPSASVIAPFAIGSISVSPPFRLWEWAIIRAYTSRELARYLPPILRRGPGGGSPGSLILIAVIVVIALIAYGGGESPGAIFMAARDLAFLFPALILSLSVHELAH